MNLEKLIQKFDLQNVDFSFEAEENLSVALLENRNLPLLKVWEIEKFINSLERDNAIFEEDIKSLIGNLDLAELDQKKLGQIEELLHYILINKECVKILEEYLI